MYPNEGAKNIGTPLIDLSRPITHIMQNAQCWEASKFTSQRGVDMHTYHVQLLIAIATLKMAVKFTKCLFVH